MKIIDTKILNGKIYNGFIEKLYMRIIHDKIMDYCKKEDVILDFGCGRNYLKKRYKNFKIIGYDLIKEFSEVDTYRKVNSDVIICCHVLEHMDKKEIRFHLKIFKRMKPRILIVATPIENLLSKLYVILFSKYSHRDHITKMNEINQILKEEFLCLDKKRKLTLTEISVWSLKN